MHSFQVPVIALFTKHDQFLLNIKMHVEDHPNEYQGRNAADVEKSQFQEYYLLPLGKEPKFVRLESAFRVKCLGYVLMSC